MLSAGYKSYKGSFRGLGEYALFWSSNEQNKSQGIAMQLDYFSVASILNEGDKNSAASVRCVKENLGEIKFKPEMAEQHFFPSFDTVSFGAQSYKIVKLGSQTWMAENLNINTKNSWCYENKPEKCSSYGRLYTWDAAKKACPVGWHLPSHVEFETLLYMAGGSDKAGLKLKSRYGWSYMGNISGNGIDAYGFSVRSTGRFVDKLGKYNSEGILTQLWSSSREDELLENSAKDPETIMFLNNSDIVVTIPSDKNDRHPIRCIKD